ncbi:MAG: RNA repair domain-containing protein [Candidatus Bathyarchaeia archaeon]
MFPLKNIFNKILWDKSLDSRDYAVTFTHRGAPSDEKTIPTTSIRHVGKSWFIYDDEGVEVYIPMHRVKRVVNLKTGEVLWMKRQPKKG